MPGGAAVPSRTYPAGEPSLPLVYEELKPLVLLFCHFVLEQPSDLDGGALSFHLQSLVEICADICDVNERLDDAVELLEGHGGRLGTCGREQASQ